MGKKRGREKKTSQYIVSTFCLKTKNNSWITPVKFTKKPRMIHRQSTQITLYIYIKVLLVFSSYICGYAGVAACVRHLGVPDLNNSTIGCDGDVLIGLQDLKKSHIYRLFSNSPNNLLFCPIGKSNQIPTCPSLYHCSAGVGKAWAAHSRVSVLLTLILTSFGASPSPGMSFLLI